MFSSESITVSLATQLSFKVSPLKVLIVELLGKMFGGIVRSHSWLAWHYVDQDSLKFRALCACLCLLMLG